MNCADLPLSGLPHIRRYLAFCRDNHPLRCDVCGQEVQKITRLKVIPKNGKLYDLSDGNNLVVCYACAYRLESRDVKEMPHQKVGLLYNDGMTMLEICSVLNLPYNAVRNSLHNNPDITIRSNRIGRDSDTEDVFVAVRMKDLKPKDAAKRIGMTLPTFYRRYAKWKK